MTDRWSALPQTTRARISNFLSGRQCHLKNLTILRRFSLPNLAYVCTKMAKVFSMFCLWPHTETRHFKLCTKNTQPLTDLVFSRRLTQMLANQRTLRSVLYTGQSQAYYDRLKKRVKEMHYLACTIAVSTGGSVKSSLKPDLFHFLFVPLQLKVLQN